jgi:phospholipid/cholesterol/gamma-HCH transport system substrate-binding protein
MRFRIRFADQIVGVLTIAALAALVAVFFILGSHQRWFARDFQYLAYFDSAVGLSKNMPVQYKGFTIGNVRDIRLTEDDRVEAVLIIFDSYAGRVREGSLVELRVSPIGLGNQFLFFAGLGVEPLPEGSVIPNSRSPEGRDLISRGLAAAPYQDDSITILVSRANALLENINKVVVQVEAAFAGSDQTSLGRTLSKAEGTIGAVEETLGTVEGVVGSVPGMVESVQGSLDGLLEDIRPVIRNLEAFSAMIAAPDGTAALVLDGGGEVYTNLEASLRAVTGTLRNLERTSDFIPSQFPHIATVILELEEALRTAQDVLVALTNNPLLRGGIPDPGWTRTDGTGSRDIRF